MIPSRLTMIRRSILALQSHRQVCSLPTLPLPRRRGGGGGGGGASSSVGGLVSTSMFKITNLTLPLPRRATSTFNKTNLNLTLPRGGSSVPMRFLSSTPGGIEDSQYVYDSAYGSDSDSDADDDDDDNFEAGADDDVVIDLDDDEDIESMNEEEYTVELGDEDDDDHGNKDLKDKGHTDFYKGDDGGGGGDGDESTNNIKKKKRKKPELNHWTGMKPGQLMTKKFLKFFCFDHRQSLEHLHPLLAKEFDRDRNFGLTAAMMDPASKRLIHWKCQKCRHSWLAKPQHRSRKRKKRGCPACADIVVKPNGSNSMAKTHPLLKQEFDTEKNVGLTPETVVGLSDLTYYWKCMKCTHSWTATPNMRYRSYQRKHCQVCLNQEVHSDGHNSMANTHPVLAMEFDRNNPDNIELGTPETITANTKKTINWNCGECGIKWKSKGNQRADRIHPKQCPGCADKVVKVDGTNSLAFSFPKVAQEWDYDNNGVHKPEHITGATMMNAAWFCMKCHHKYQMPVRDRTKKDKGCMKCYEADKVKEKMKSLEKNIKREDRSLYIRSLQGVQISKRSQVRNRNINRQKRRGSKSQNTIWDNL